MVGHGIKTANRGEAIKKNSARVEMLARKLEELAKLTAQSNGDIAEQVEGIIEEMEEMENGFAEQILELKERLDLLERPIWRKIMDKVKKKEPTPPTPNHRAVVLDIHSVKHTTKAETKKRKEESEDGQAESRND
jgi:hypothetical protein